MLRFFGTPESAVAEALATAGGEGEGVEVTICAREFEIHVDLFVEPEAEERGAEVVESLRTSLGGYLFGEDERSIAQIVLDLCRRNRSHDRHRRVVHRRHGCGPSHSRPRRE